MAMREKRRSLTPAFKAETVQMIRESSQAVVVVARDLDLTESAGRNWGNQADIDADQGRVVFRISINLLRAAVREYLTHYHEERNHQGLGGQIIVPPVNHNRTGPIVCRERIGGLLRFYPRKVD